MKTAPIEYQKEYILEIKCGWRKVLRGRWWEGRDNH
jgi:hypothetical protein